MQNKEEWTQDGACCDYAREWEGLRTVIIGYGRQGSGRLVGLEP